MSQPPHVSLEIPVELIHAAADPHVAASLIHRWFDVRESEHRLLERLLDLQLAAIGTAPQGHAEIRSASRRTGHESCVESISTAETASVPTATLASPPGDMRSEPMGPAATHSLRPTGVRSTTSRHLAATTIQTAPEQQPVPASAVPRVPVEKAAALPISPNGEAPSVEAFRRDLLRVTSLRTGYPVETLDETLPLEAGLGIDSIKTVEIFSNLKRYHPFLLSDSEDEEETLAEFAKLQTLGDIVKMYESRRTQFSAGIESRAGSPDVTNEERDDPPCPVPA